MLNNVHTIKTLIFFFFFFFHPELQSCMIYSPLVILIVTVNVAPSDAFLLEGVIV